MTGATATAELRELPAPAPGAPVPEWVQLLPATDPDGMIRARDGRAWRLDDPAAVVAAFAAHGADLALDFDHAADKPALAGDAERLRAAGWISALEVRDGAVWGRVSWTDRAAEMIARKEWRYISPVISFDPTSRAFFAIIGAALVHRPALHLKAVAAEEVAPAEKPAGSLAARLAAMLGLDPATDEEELLARVADRLHLAAMSAEATASTAATGTDPRLDAAAVALAEVTRQRAELAAELRRRDAADRVARAEASGAINSVTREWALALAESGPRSFDHWLELAAPTFARLLQPSHTTAAPPPGRAATLAERTDPEGRIAHALGIAPERLTD